LSHYFSNNETLERKIRDIFFVIDKTKFHFKTDNGVFSKLGLDFGSRLLIETVKTLPYEKVLDLGCGYGPIGLTYKFFHPTANLTMIDINERAVDLTKKNAELNSLEADVFASDGFAKVKTKFDLILSNPPIRAGKDLLQKLLKESADYLTENGRLIYVIHKNLGAKTSYAFCEGIYKKVDIINKKSGYYIIQCIK